jgi:calcineurin-like phosphoesterase family protein
MNWFISDTHYGHKNIVKGISEWSDKSGCRDFDDLYTHDSYSINLINMNVQENDTLWHLGDWSFGGKQNIKRFRNYIMCKNVHLITGNHDHHMIRHPQEYEGLDMFQSIQPYKELVIDDLMLVLSHYPMESWNCQERGSIHLHGHVHGNLKHVIPNRWDVGVDALGLINVDALRRLHVPIGISRHTEVNGGNSFGN